MNYDERIAQVITYTHVKLTNAIFPSASANTTNIMLVHRASIHVNVDIGIEHEGTPR